VVWTGLGEGWGHLQGWQIEVLVDGRGAAARPRRGWVALAGEPVSVPAPGGRHEEDVPVLEMRAG
jgi:hypothetical protein